MSAIKMYIVRLIRQSYVQVMADEKGFQNLLQSMMTSLQAGYSLNNSCRIALKELEELYQDQNNPMLRQMRRIIQGLDLHITLEQLFMERVQD